MMKDFVIDTKTKYFICSLKDFLIIIYLGPVEFLNILFLF